MFENICIETSQNKCYKIQQLSDSLKIYYNTSNSTVVCYNKYQILVYENLCFESVSRIFTPEFIVANILVSNNYLFCLDTSGNVHATSLKFKQTNQKRIKTCFLPKEQCILAFGKFNDDIVISLKLNNDGYYIYLNKFNSDFGFINKILINFNQTNHKSFNVLCLKVNEDNLDILKNNFDVEDKFSKTFHIVIITFDHKTIYGCLFNHERCPESIKMIKLYECSSEVCSVQIQDSFIFIGLKIGSLIKLSLLDIKSKPEYIHLNVAILKYEIHKDSVYYTDGLTMWRCDKYNSDCDINFKQLIVRNLKDFVKVGDFLICTTYSHLIYYISIEDNRSYIEPISTSEYCAAEKLLNQKDYLDKINKESEINNALVIKVLQESNYITALSLSRRQDLMKKNIVAKAYSSYSFEDVINKNTDIILIEKINEYYTKNIFFIVVKVTTSPLDPKIREILSNQIGDFRMHIELLTQNKSMKNICIKINDPLKSANICIPIKEINITAMTIKINLVTAMPGSLDERQNIWISLYKNDIELKSEHFIKPNIIKTDKIIYKESDLKIENFLANAAMLHFGNLFKITNIENKTNHINEFILYAKLPNNFKELITNLVKVTESSINENMMTHIFEQMCSDMFLNLKGTITFDVANIKVTLKISDDTDDEQCIMIKSNDLNISINIRNFIINIIHKDLVNLNRDFFSVPYAFYNNVENLQKSIRSSITAGDEPAIIQNLNNEFQKRIAGKLPF